MDLTRYLLFTSLVKHGGMLRYLFASQVRKRLLEQYQLRRQVKSSALTGNPDRLFELYYINKLDEGEAEKTFERLRDDPSFVASQQVIDDVRITEDERIHDLIIPPAIVGLSQMPYLTESKSQRACSQAVAEAPYLLHVTCTLHEKENLTQFNKSMSVLIKEFERAGLSLVVAGQRTCKLELPADPKQKVKLSEIAEKEEQRVEIINIWEFDNPDNIKRLMMRHAESQAYAELDEICDQEQHFCRNVSRHYQRYPLLGGNPLSIT
ncbi:hypothetical protein [Hyalangium versicolor]|uniref:hypothetical protein n=1 Tax=Hyalangium versicolor TaxID=2861190 RepID=UPI001CCF5A3C|nr:hypothetical protein [Hyalangium versicolor]